MNFLKNNWFPIALIALFILAIPGVILCILHLAGMDGPVNVWLQETFNLTYHLALPAPLALLLLLLPLLLLLLYFLKLKRKALAVPSTYLWKKSIEDLHVNSLLQWLRQNVLLVLQLLVLLVLIYSVMGFRFHGSTSSGRHYIVMIDNSASMSATDVAPSRLEWAKQEALKEIDGAGDSDVGMVIVFNSKANTLQGYTGNRTKLREAVRSIEPTARTTRIEEALILAESLANPVRSTEDAAVRPEDVKPGEERTFVQAKGISTTVHLYSDGRFPRLTDAALANLGSKEAGSTKALGNLDLRYHRVGKPGPKEVNNVGIIAFNAVRHAADKPAKIDLDTQKLNVLVRIRNYRDQAIDPEKGRGNPLRLHLDVLMGGQLIHADQKILRIPARKVTPNEADPEDEEKDVPGEGPALDFKLPPLDLQKGIVLRAYLQNNQDDFPLDDEAWLVVGAIRKAKVLIVGPDNPVLEAFFNQEAVTRLASYQTLEPKGLAGDAYRKLAGSGEVDLIIFDRCAPASEEDMPQANTMFFDQVPPPWVRGKKKLANPYLVPSKKDLPLLRFITTLHDVGVTEVFAFDVKKDIQEKIKSLFDLPDGDKNKRFLPPLVPLLEATGGQPVLFTLPRGPYTDLVLTFPLVNEAGDLVTNWPLQPSFPLFMRNVLYQLGNVDDSVRAPMGQPGEPMVLRPEAGVQSLTVTPPGGKPEVLKRVNRPDFVFADTDKIGVYQVKRDDGGLRSFAVNLLDPAESNLEPREQVRFGAERVTTDQARSTPQDLWKWVLLLAVLLLVLEWAIYNIRVAL